VRGRDKRLKAHPADDLFESGVVASCRDKQGAYRDLRQVFEVFASQAAETQSYARRRLEKQGADVGFFLAVTGD